MSTNKKCNTVTAKKDLSINLMKRRKSPIWSLDVVQFESYLTTHFLLALRWTLHKSNNKKASKKYLRDWKQSVYKCKTCFRDRSAWICVKTQVMSFNCTTPAVLPLFPVVLRCSPTEESSRRLTVDEMYLVDSGGQYLWVRTHPAHSLSSFTSRLSHTEMTHRVSHLLSETGPLTSLGLFTGEPQQTCNG